MIFLCNGTKKSVQRKMYICLACLGRTLWADNRPIGDHYSLGVKIKRSNNDGPKICWPQDEINRKC